MNTLGLVNLDCPSCGSAMKGEGRDTLFFCTHCGSAAILDEAGLEPVDSTALLPAPGRHPTVWRPGWRLEVDVRVHQRRLASGRETEGWEGRRVFYIPAFELSLDDLTRLARALSDVSENRGEVPKEPVRGGVLSHGDALVLVRHLLIGDEVRRSDMLASVEVDVEEIGRSLVALPFEAADGALRCGVTGVTVR